MQKFWNYSENGNELRLEGEISEQSWWGDEVTPKAFREELDKHPGPLTVYINSPGGDVFAASQIYTMLMEHQGGVTVKIDALAASAASVIAMAGTEVLMAPTAYLMIHDPLTVVYGNKGDLKEAIKTLDEVKEGLLNAYELKTKLPRDRIASLMDGDGTYMNAQSAIELGFADGLIGAEAQPKQVQMAQLAAKGGQAHVWNSGSYARALVEKISDTMKPAKPEETPAYADEATLKAYADKMAKLAKKY